MTNDDLLGYAARVSDAVAGLNSKISDAIKIPGGNEAVDQFLEIMRRVRIELRYVEEDLALSVYTDTKKDVDRSKKSR